VSLLWLALAFAGDPVIDAMQAELARSTAELSLPDAQGPYHVGYRLSDVYETRVTAQLGGVSSSSGRPIRNVGVEVRVGSPVLDNSNFESWDDGFRSTRLVLDDVPSALRHDLWLSTDMAYKDAVETLAAKQAARLRRAQGSDVPDFVPGEARQAEGEAAPADASEPLIETVRALSEVFLDHPEIEFSRGFGRAVHGRRVMVDSGGTEVSVPIARVAVRIVARARADDGTTNVDDVLWVVRHVDDLPPLPTMQAEVRELAERLAAWRDAPPLDEEYIGPVLFEGDAAVDLVRHLLLPPLAGTPPEEKAPRGSRFVAWDDDEAPGPMRPRRRILPPGFTLTDDPTAEPHLPSSYRFDREGQAARAVTLVDDGVVQTHLMSRTPNDSTQGSTGHGRTGGYGDLVRAHPAQPTLKARRSTAPRRLHKQAVDLASDYDQDHYIVIRKLRDPAVDRMDGGPVLTGRQMFGFGDERGLPDVVEVVRVHADGREELVRGAALAGIDTRSMRDIVAAGATHRRTLLDDDVPVTITSPDLLLDEGELTPSRADAEKPPEVPSPLAGSL